MSDVQLDPNQIWPPPTRQVIFYMPAATQLNPSKLWQSDETSKLKQSTSSVLFDPPEFASLPKGLHLEIKHLRIVPWQDQTNTALRRMGFSDLETMLTH